MKIRLENCSWCDDFYFSVHVPRLGNRHPGSKICCTVAALVVPLRLMKFDLLTSGIQLVLCGKLVLSRKIGNILHADCHVVFCYVQGHWNGRSLVRTSAGMAHFSIMWQGPPTMEDEAFLGG